MSMDEKRVKPAVLFVWSNFGPYHIDRLQAAASTLAQTHHVVGIEIAGSTKTYPWNRTEQISGFERVTLFPDSEYERIPKTRQFMALLRTCLATDARHIFLCHYEELPIYLLAILLRLFRRRVYVMNDSKFDDKPRVFWREILKKIFFLPYNGALVSGRRTRDYLRWFGVDPNRILTGYDTVSVDRIRRLAAAPPAPDGLNFRDRHFTILARLVPKKNIGMALDAYAHYCREAGPSARELHICGSGILENELRQKARELDIPKAKFRGFVQPHDVARALASSLALILPSTEEQWGLVINEALAMGVPILCSSNVGARDLLVETAVNGFVFEPDNSAGLASLMSYLANDENAWRRLAKGSGQMAHLGDTQNFGAAVARLICAEGKSSRS